MKLKENFFTSERMVVLEMMPDGILYSNLLLKMYLMSLKHNGVLLLHEKAAATISVSFASVQARKLNHYAVSPLLTKPSGFAGSPRRASEKRAVGSLGRLHHAAQSVWTHNVRP